MSETRQLFGLVVVAVKLVTPTAALAEPQFDSEKIERLQRETTRLKEQLQHQIELMQAQLQALQEELRKTRGELKQVKADRTQSDQPVYGWKTSKIVSNQPDTYKPESTAAEAYTGVPEEIRRAPNPLPGQTSRAAGSTKDIVEAGVVQFPNGRPTIASADGRMSLAVGTLVQFDTGGYFQEKDIGVFEPAGARELNNGENLRRGRIYFVGKIDDWTANITPDFGGSPDGAPTLYEANLNYTINSLTATIGYFKPYDTLARSQSDGDALFLERPGSAYIASNLADGSRRASAGFKIATEDYFLASYLTGARYGSQDPVLLNLQQAGGTLRLATRPVHGEDWNLHVGFSGSTVFNFDKSNFQPGGRVEGVELSDQPELRIDFNKLIDTGFIPAHTADTWGFELAANWQNVLIEGEYINIDVNPTVGHSLDFGGWYVEGSWILTGESRPYLVSSATYGRPNPAHPFQFYTDGGWGAFELAGRYSVTELNSGFVFGGRQEVASAALIWYPNAHVRFTLQGSHVDVNRLDPTGTVQVGQSFWDLALRTQVTF